MSKKTLLSESQIRQFMKLAKLEPLTPGFVEGLTENTEELEERGMMRMRDEDEEMEEGMRGMRRAEDEEMEEGMRGMRRDEDEMDEMRHARDEDEMDEVRTGLGPDYDLTRPKRGHGRGTGAADGLEEQEEMEEAAHEAPELDAADDKMGMDAEMGAPAADAGKMVSVDDFLSALERALEDAMGEEVEIDSDEAAADEPADAMDAMDDEPADDMMEAKHEDDEKLDEGEHADKEDKLDEGEHADKEEKVDEALMESITKRVAKRILMEALNAKK